jgi:hypothetical protein
MAVLKLEQPAMPGVTLVKGFLGSVRRKEGSESAMKAAEEIIAAAAAILCREGAGLSVTRGQRTACVHHGDA